MTVLIRRDVLNQATQFLEGRGAVGCEGTGMLGGLEDDTGVTIGRFLAPDQKAGTYPSCWVEVTRLGQYQLAVTLGPGERWLARIHSHPGEAFHSGIDDANPGLTAEGAISIVVPYFGLGLRQGVGACAFFRRHGARWLATTVDEIGLEVV